MNVGTLDIQLMADMSRLYKDMQDAKRLTDDSMTAMTASMLKAQQAINAMGEAEKARAGVFSRTLAETTRLLKISQDAAGETAKSLANMKINPEALKIPSEAFASLKSWQEKSAYAIGAGASIGWEKAKTAWDDFKGFMERQVVIWGVALAVGVSATVLGAVYAAFKGVGFLVGLLTGESYKSEHIDALKKINDEVKSLHESLPLTAVGASALNQALKAQGISATGYASTLGAVETASRTNGDELDRLGVKYKNQNGAYLTTRERLESVAAVLATYTAGWDRHQAEQAIGMGSEKQIQDALAVTAEKVSAAKSRLVDYGLVIGEGTQEAVAKYELAMKSFAIEADLTSQGFSRSIADNIMPVLTDLADFFKDGFPFAVMAFRYSFATVTSLFYGLKTVVFMVTESILGGISAIGSGLGGLASAAWLALKGDFSGAKEALVKGWEDAKIRLGDIGANIVGQARHNSDAMALAWGADSLGANNAADAVGKVGKSWEKADIATKANAVASDYQKLADEMSKVEAMSQAEIDSKVELSASDKFRTSTLEKLIESYQNGKVSLTEYIDLEAKMTDVEGIVAQAEAHKKMTKADLDAAEAHNKYIASLVEGLDKMKADTLAQQESNDRLGLSKEVIAALDAAKLESQAVTLELLAIKTLDKNLDEAQYNLYKDQASELRKLAILKGQGAAKEAGIDAAKKVAEEWQKGWGSTDQIARNAFTGWAENGTNMAEAIGNSLKKALLSAIYEATIRPIAFQIYSSAAGALGMDGGSSTGGSLMSGISAASGAKSLYTGLQSYFGGATATSAATISSNAALGTMLSGGDAASAALAAKSAGSAGQSITGAGSTSAYTYIGMAMMADSSLFDAGYKWDSKASIIDPVQGLNTGIFEGLGMSQKGASILTGSSLEKAIGDKIVGLFTGPQAAQTMGAAQGTYDATGKLTASQAIDVGQTDKQIKNATERANILAQSYYSIAGSLGIKGVGATFGFNSNTGRDGQNENVDFRVKAGDKSYSSGEIGRTDKEGITLATSRAIMTALQASEMPKYLSEIFDGFTASTATQTQIDDITKLAQSYAGLHTELQALPFAYLKDMSFKAAEGLVSAAGGMDKLGTALGNYYNDFYSDTEKRDQLIKNTTASFKDLGIVLPALDESTRAWYRSEVERLGKMDMSVAANASAYTSILKLSGAMNTLAPEAQAAASSLKTVLDVVTKATTDAMAALKNSVDAQKTLLASAFDAQTTRYNDQITSVTNSVGKLQSLASSLSSTLSGMQISGSESAYRASAQAQISAALATARSGGGLPLDGQLTNALATVSKPSEMLFATFQDYAKDFYKTANSISALSDLTGLQLTADETTQAILTAQLSALNTSHDADIKALDALVASGQSSLDAANGNLTATLSVFDAVNAVNASVLLLVAERASQGLASSGASSSTNPNANYSYGDGSSFAASDSSPADAAEYQQRYLMPGGTTNAYDVTSASEIARYDGISSTIQSIGVGSLSAIQDLASAVIAQGGTMQDVATASGYNYNDIVAVFATAGVPAFASGGNHAGGMRLVGEGGPELEVTGPSRIFNASQTRSMLQGGSNDSEVASELRQLRALVDRLLSSSENTEQSSKKTADTLIRVTRGGEAMQAESTLTGSVLAL